MNKNEDLDKPSVFKGIVIPLLLALTLPVLAFIGYLGYQEFNKYIKKEKDMSYQQGVQESERRQNEERGIYIDPKSVISQDPTILQTLKSVGAKDYSTLSMSIHDGTVCGNDYFEGCYGNSEIIMRKGHESNKTIVAHEYLHYMWFKNQLDKDRQLVSDLISFYSKTPEFQNRIPKHYTDSGGLLPTELFSYACTEIQDSRLTPYIVQKCNEYIDRSTLQMKF